MNKLSKTSHQKTACADFGDNSGSEFPDVTEQTSFVSEVSGRAPSDSLRSIISTLASTFIGDRLSTNIMSPTDSSATLSSDYHSSSESANLSSKILYFFLAFLNAQLKQAREEFKAKLQNNV